MANKVMTAAQFVDKAIDIAKNYKTLYVMGCFGAPLTGDNVKRYCTNHSYNKNSERTAMIKAAANKNPPVYGFDCVCLIKGILWGWSGKASSVYGGATYPSNGVPDIDADSMIKVCSGVSTDFSNIVPGEAVWMSGHIGIYIGDGLAVECSPKWANCVQITAVGNIGSKSGYNTRTWTKHGKLPYIDYSVATTPQPQPAPTPTPTTPEPKEENGLSRADVEKIIKEVFSENFSSLRKDRQGNASGQWSEAARAWAIETGLISGIGDLPDGTPNYAWTDFVTREQLVTFLYRLFNI